MVIRTQTDFKPQVPPLFIAKLKMHRWTPAVHRAALHLRSV